MSSISGCQEREKERMLLLVLYVEKHKARYVSVSKMPVFSLLSLRDFYIELLSAKHKEELLLTFSESFQPRCGVDCVTKQTVPWHLTQHSQSEDIRTLEFNKPTFTPTIPAQHGPVSIDYHNLCNKANVLFSLYQYECRL